MSKRTRLFLLASAAVLIAVVVAGVIARVVVAAVASNTPEELAYVTATTRMVAYADVHQLMASPLHDRWRDLQKTGAPTGDDLEARTGIRFDRDIDHVVIASAGDTQGASSPSLVIARGRFDQARIDAAMRQQGAHASTYRGKPLLSIKDATHDATVALAEPGLLLFGPQAAVRDALDAKAGAGAIIASNREFMALVDEVDDGTAWSVARFDSLSGRTPLPSSVVSQLPPIDWIAASGHVDSGVRGLVRAEAHDEQAAQNLHDVVQGFLALARLQGSRDPAYKALLDTVVLNAQGKSVSMSFEVTPAMLDTLRAQGSARRTR
jgi:hypothetical protein